MQDERKKQGLPYMERPPPDSIRTWKKYWSTSRDYYCLRNFGHLKNVLLTLMVYERIVVLWQDSYEHFQHLDISVTAVGNWLCRLLCSQYLVHWKYDSIKFLNFPDFLFVKLCFVLEWYCWVCSAVIQIWSTLT
jgi:hypothetical protein